jgi:putative heme utilization carrier protein HutX
MDATTQSATVRDGQGNGKPTSEQVSRIRAALEENPNQMTLQLARDVGVSEVEVLRQFPDGRAIELDASRWEELIRSFEALGTVHVIVSNAGATLEANGQFGNFSTWGEFFNVQTKSLDMHIRWPQLAAAFAVEKPSHMTGINTLSFQFYDQGGACAFKVFLSMGNAKVPAERAALFNRLRERFKKA